MKDVAQSVPGTTKFPRLVFLVAGVYGLLALSPQYVLLDRIGRDTPPAVTHVEYFYGFVGIALVFQVVFLIISSDPIRYRPLMLPAVLENLSFGVPAIVLFMQHKIAATVLAFGCIDLLLGTFFLIAWIKTPARAGV
jgi:hypothetical protein